jgi:ribonuclease E
VLNHKRGHLRDLENSFKVTLAVIADPTVSAQQSFVIDRGEQVHTLEAAKALLAAQVAAFPPQIEEAYDEEEPFDVEAESEVETDETEGLTEDLLPAGEESGGETEADGHKRKRRRRRRGRPGEAREGGPARDENDIPRVASSPVAVPGVIAEEGESDEDESEEQPGMVRADQGPGGERRPRRRGRRGGRRRRGGPEDGLAGSIADELGPTPAPEATNAVADFDGYSPPAAPPMVQPESFAPPAPPPELHQADPAPPEPARAPAEVETAQEAERAARRRSTVREKVSFLVDAQPAAAPASVAHSQPEPAAAPATAEPASETTTDDTQPRKAGWWSRRFGNGE